MMPSRDLLSLILSLSLVAVLSVSSRAQAVYGSVFGTVTDPRGARVVGAVVTVTELTKNVTTTAQTNESGSYTMTHLTPGRYQVKVEQQEYKIVIQEGEVRADVAAREREIAEVRAELLRRAEEQGVEPFDFDAALGEGAEGHSQEEIQREVDEFLRRVHEDRAR